MIDELDSKPFVDALGEIMVAFAAGYLAATFRGCPIEEALRIANAAGALTTTVSGDIEGFSGWDELERFTRAPEGAVRR